MTMGPYGVHWERTADLVGDGPALTTITWPAASLCCAAGLPVADMLLPGPGGRAARLPSADFRHARQPAGPARLQLRRLRPRRYLARQRARSKSGRLDFPGGMSYRPAGFALLRHDDPASLAQGAGPGEAGATVVGARASKSPSLSGYPSCDAEVRRLGDGLWGEAGDSGAGEPGLNKKSAGSPGSLPGAAGA